MCLRGQFSLPCPPRSDLTDLALALGAKVIPETELAAAAKQALTWCAVVTDVDSKAAAASPSAAAAAASTAIAKLPTVSFRWLLDSASCYSVLELGPYAA